MKGKTFLILSGISLVLHPGFAFSQIRPNITVARDGSGDYTTVQAAFNAVAKNNPARTIIYIKNGTYKEKLVLESDRKNVTLIGQDRNSVKLTYDDYSGKVVNGETIGTSTSRSTFIRAEGFCAINITFENSSGPVGQALAIYIGGDKAIFYNCSFLGRQDTWYGGNCRQFIRRCYIEGSTDFMFGPSTAWIDSSQLYTYGGSAITAASTEQYVTYGYVFRYCTITGASGVSTTLGRPWRPYAAVSFLNCSMTSCIKPAGWDNWGNTANEGTARYFEYKNTGTGAATDKRVSWAKQLTDTQVAAYTILNVLKTTYTNPATTDNWDPLATLSPYLSSASQNQKVFRGIGNLIDSLFVYDTPNADNWGISSSLTETSILFGDRTYTPISIPQTLSGCEWIYSAVDSKTYSASDTCASFLIRKDCFIYVAHPDRVTEKPDWLRLYEPTGLSITVMENPETARTLTLYRRRFSKNNMVVLGKNSKDGATANLMYVAIIIEATTSLVRTELPGILQYQHSSDKAELLPGQRNGSIFMYDLRGKLIFTKSAEAAMELKSKRLNISNGTYIMKLQSEDGTAKHSRSSRIVISTNR